MTTVKHDYGHVYEACQEIYFASQNDHFRVDSPAARSYQQILEASLGKSFDQIDADFVEWFGAPR